MKRLIYWKTGIIPLICCVQVLLPIASSAATGIVGGWGSASGGSLTIPNGPSGLSNVLAVSAGSGFSLALTTGRTVLAWGENYYGQTNVPAGLSNVIAISAGRAYSGLALKSDGRVVTWGENNGGQNTVPSSLSNVTAISQGSGFNLALRADGTVVAWGYNHLGQVTGTPSNDSNPVSANPVTLGGQVLSSVVAIAAGSSHSLALKIDGTVVAWGRNLYGETNVPAGLSGVLAISAGPQTSFAIKNYGTVVAWGDNASGAVSVPNGLTNVLSVAAGQGFSVALRSDGTVVGWGDDSQGAVSGGTGLKGISAISAGYSHCLAIGPGPFIVEQPAATTVVEGTNVTLAVSASSLFPPSFQWRFNGLSIIGATNGNLALTNIPLSQAGNYSVVISNSSGSAVTSKSAKVTVNPANDSFSRAQHSPSIGGRVLGSTTAAGKEPGEPDHSDNRGGKSIWFSWVAPASGTASIDTIGSDFDTLLAVYAGTGLTNLVLLAADDDGAVVRGNSKLSMSVTQGTLYYIAVDGFRPSSGFNAGITESGGVVLNIALDRPVIGGQVFLSRQSGFQAQLGARAASSLVVQSSEDLRTWRPLATNSVPDAGVLNFTDQQATNAPRRFYRVIER